MKIAGLLLGLIMPVCLVAQKKADDIIGNWIVGDNKAKIQVYRSGTKYYGKITWLKEPVKNGKQKVGCKKPGPEEKKHTDHRPGSIERFCF
jgi:uncharacterized protein (DUF2147 family)